MANIIAPPMANLSTNWSNNPSIYTDFSLVLEESSNIGSHLICGFYCPSTQQTQSSCLFGVVIFDSIYHPSINNFSFIRAPQLAWSANGERPIQINATLQLTEDGDLILHNLDGTFVWSTNTSSKSVFGHEIHQIGKPMKWFGSHLITQPTPYLLVRLCFLVRSSSPAHTHRIGLQVCFH
ncbi:hypothetical protein HYC85_026809 [Camellia sinensis]|uniref:Bulb-type lectin domain-containing protein n=1 Tax=Camellia sinensis TaxID=4442 RepID=A0A7J7G4N2_CAMSI|nr:hypothetical protein HYC85_026809 [Camellia sinensis]